MKPKQLIVLLATCGLVLGIALWKRAGRAGDEPDSPSADNPPLFSDFNPEEVGSFTIKSTKNETTVAREGEQWVVANRDKFPASMRHVSEMLNNTGAFHVASYEDFDGEAVAGNKLLAPGEGKEEESGTLITMNKPGGGSELLSFVAGSSITGKSDAGMPPRAQWMKVKGGNKIAKVVDGFSNLHAEPKEWLDKDKFFKVEKLKTVTVAGPTPEESWKLIREKEGGELKLDAPAAGEEFDAAKASGQGAAFNYPSFDDILPEAEKAKAGLDKPTHTITLETFDGLTYVVKVGAKVEAPKPEEAKDGATPPPAPPESYYIAYTITGAVSETLPPFAEPAPVAPTAPAAVAADANDEAKKKHAEDTKNFEAAKASHESNLKAWEERKKTADEQAKKDLDKRKETIASQQAQQNRIWIVQKSPTLEAVMKKRAEMMKDKPAATTPPATGATPPAPGSPAGTPGSATPPVSVTPVPAPPGGTGKIEAVTPPIEVKIPEAKKDDAAKPDAKKEDSKKNR